uniref:Uncharacterized protein n=1 Tax=Steinernema glaseri TaxID=37863 RepID=A0A1I7Y1K6_9BILA
MANLTKLITKMMAEHEERIVSRLATPNIARHGNSIAKDGNHGQEHAGFCSRAPSHSSPYHESPYGRRRTLNNFFHDFEDITEGCESTERIKLLRNKCQERAKRLIEEMLDDGDRSYPSIKAKLHRFIVGADVESIQARQALADGLVRDRFEELTTYSNRVAETVRTAYPQIDRRGIEPLMEEYFIRGLEDTQLVATLSCYSNLRYEELVAHAVRIEGHLRYARSWRNRYPDQPNVEAPPPLLGNDSIPMVEVADEEAVPVECDQPEEHEIAFFLDEESHQPEEDESAFCLDEDVSDLHVQTEEVDSGHVNEVAIQRSVLEQSHDMETTHEDSEEAMREAEIDLVDYFSSMQDEEVIAKQTDTVRVNRLGITPSTPEQICVVKAARGDNNEGMREAERNRFQSFGSLRKVAKANLKSMDQPIGHSRTGRRLPRVKKPPDRPKNGYRERI